MLCGGFSKPTTFLEFRNGQRIDERVVVVVSRVGERHDDVGARLIVATRFM